jgi:branched-chain amino acid transport system substrate-binding protein
MGRAKVPSREDELRIGGIFPLTGYLSWAGTYKKKGADLKVELINQAGGIDGRPVTLIAYDDQSSAEQATRIAETLIFKHRVVAMVGTGSLPISQAVARVANRLRTPAFVNSGYAVDPTKDLFVFNTAHKTEFAVACSFQYFLERGINRLALLMPHGPLGELGSWLARRLGSRMGIRIVGEERFDAASPDVTSRLKRLHSLKPLALFSFVTGGPAAHVAETMAALGLDIPLLLSHGNANPRFLRLISHTPISLIVPSGKTMVLDTIREDDPCRGVVMDFNARHVQRYGEPANYYSAELADAVDLVVEGVRQTGNADPVRLRDAVENISNFGGMQGVYNLSPIDHYGTHIEQIILLTVKDGAWRFAKAFSSIALLEDFHGNQKSRLIRRLGDLLSGPGSGTVFANESPASADIKAVRTGLNCIELTPDLYFAAKLYCHQKLEMMRSIRERDIGKAKEILFRLLTVVLLQHFESLETLKLAVLELFLGLFDVAMEEGIEIEELVRAKHRFSREWENVKDQETLCLWLVRVFDRVSQNLIAHDHAGKDLLKRVMDFIEAHAAEDLHVERVARDVCLSPSRLMHWIRSEYNVSLAACITKVRIERAKRLLRNTSAPIGRIAQEVGYRDQAHFTRVFKKCLGETPKDYRAKGRLLGTPKSND